MSFNMDYLVEIEVLHSTPPPGSDYPELYSFGSSIVTHSQKLEFIYEPSGRLRIRVLYQRQLKPIETSILNKVHWLKRHYPFQRWYYSPVYEWKKPE